MPTDDLRVAGWIFRPVNDSSAMAVAVVLTESLDFLGGLSIDTGEEHYWQHHLPRPDEQACSELKSEVGNLRAMSLDSNISRGALYETLASAVPEARAFRVVDVGPFWRDGPNANIERLKAWVVSKGGGDVLLEVRKPIS